MNANVARQTRFDETSEWLEAFEQVLTDEGRDGATKLLEAVLGGQRKRVYLDQSS